MNNLKRLRNSFNNMVIELIQPPVYIPFFCTELHSNFNQLTPVYLIRYQIAFFINLLQSLFGRGKK